MIYGILLLLLLLLLLLYCNYCLKQKKNCSRRLKLQLFFKSTTKLFKIFIKFISNKQNKTKPNKKKRNKKQKFVFFYYFFLFKRKATECRVINPCMCFYYFTYEVRFETLNARLNKVYLKNIKLTTNAIPPYPYPYPYHTNNNNKRNQPTNQKTLTTTITLISWNLFVWFSSFFHSFCLFSYWCCCCFQEKKKTDSHTLPPPR